MIVGQARPTKLHGYRLRAGSRCACHCPRHSGNTRAYRASETTEVCPLKARSVLVLAPSSAA